MPTPPESDPLAARAAADVRERFLREALARVPAERVVEAHVFAPLRQGGVESGIAVLAAAPERDVAGAALGADALGADALGADALGADAPGADGPGARHTVYVARYRLVLKGPERGRWEVAVREEADAPLLTVDAVVRGVGRRASDAAEATRLDGAALRALAGPPGLLGAGG